MAEILRVHCLGSDRWTKSVGQAGGSKWRVPESFDLLHLYEIKTTRKSEDPAKRTEKFIWNSVFGYWPDS
jgi:hypothetical protein